LSTHARHPVDGVHVHGSRRAWSRHRARAEVRVGQAGDRARRARGRDAERRGERADPSSQPGDGLPAGQGAGRAAPAAVSDTELPYGAAVLPKIYAAWTESGMIANIGARLVSAEKGSLVIEADMSAERHGFPTARGLIVHGGAIATLAGEGEATATSSLHIDYYRPAAVGRLIARATVRHRTKRLAYCHATVEQAD